MGQAKSSVSKQILVILNIWMAYILLSKMVLVFPHWKIPLVGFFNYDLYFLIVLVAIAIFLKDPHNRYVYLNLAVFSLIYVLGFLTLFLGKAYSIGGDNIQYQVWIYRKILISIATTITIIYIPIDFLFHEKKTGIKYLMSAAITLPVSFFYYKDFLINPVYINQNYMKIFSGILGMNFLALFFIVLYAYLFFNQEKPISGYVNLLVLGFLIYLGIDSVDNYYNYLQKPLPALSQVFLIFNLVLFILILVRTFDYINSEFGKFYENLRHSKIKLDIRVIRKQAIYEKYLIWFHDYFCEPTHRFYLKVLMFILLAGFLYFYPNGYSKLSFLVVIFLTIVLTWYLNLLIKRRAKIQINSDN